MDNDFTNAGNTKEDTFPNEPAPVHGWSWGAFMLAVPFGIGNGVYLSLLSLIPIFSLFWSFVCGAKGYEWAQNAKTYASVESFNEVMESWDRAGKVLFVAEILLAIALVNGLMTEETCYQILLALLG